MLTLVFLTSDVVDALSVSPLIEDNNFYPAILKCFQYGLEYLIAQVPINPNWTAHICVHTCSIIIALLLSRFMFSIPAALLRAVTVAPLPGQHSFHGLPWNTTHLGHIQYATSTVITPVRKQKKYSPIIDHLITPQGVVNQLDEHCRVNCNTPWPVTSHQHPDNIIPCISFIHLYTTPEKLQLIWRTCSG